MWGLEYALTFGVPGKLELDDGRTRCAFPSLSREKSELLLADWSAALCRWKGLPEGPSLRAGLAAGKVEAGGFLFEIINCPLDLRIPLDFDAFLAIDASFWRRDLWEGQPAGLEAGWESRHRHWDVHHNLWTLFGGFCQRHGGQHAGRVDIALSDTASAAPDQCYFNKPRRECMIRDDYFRGTPDVVVEVLSPATRAFDRGPRKAVYRRAGVPHLWLVDPELETVELLELASPDYRTVATHRSGDSFRPALFSAETVGVDALFDTQWKRHGMRTSSKESDRVPEWLISPETPLGLEYLLLLGHPERRTEIWGNRVPCVLSFGSPAEARARFVHFVEDAARWEQVAAPRTTAHEPDAEEAEVGRFRLTRRGRQVQLDVAVDGRKYRQLLELWANHDAWDWGEESVRLG
jgi:hypothetical protein